MFQAADRRIRITCIHQPAGDIGKSIKHVALDLEWICGGKRHDLTDAPARLICPGCLILRRVFGYNAK